MFTVNTCKRRTETKNRLVSEVSATKKGKCGRERETEGDGCPSVEGSRKASPRRWEHVSDKPDVLTGKGRDDRRCYQLCDPSRCLSFPKRKTRGLDPR